MLWRFSHVTSRIWLLVLLWAVVGGMFLVLFVFITFVIFYHISNRLYSNIANKATINHYQQQLEIQCNKLSQLEVSLLELQKRDDRYSDIDMLLVEWWLELGTISDGLIVELKWEKSISKMFVETPLPNIKKGFAVAQSVLSQMPFDNSDDVNTKPNKLAKSGCHLICDIFSKMVLFFMFHLIGVRWTLDTLNDLPIYHIFHRGCEDIFALTLILSFALIQFNCNLSIDLCANYDIRNIYDNVYVLIYTVVFIFTALISPLFFCLLKIKVYTIKQDCDTLMHLMNSSKVEAICDQLSKFVVVDRNDEAITHQSTSDQYDIVYDDDGGSNVHANINNQPPNQMPDNRTNNNSDSNGGSVIDHSEKSIISKPYISADDWSLVANADWNLNDKNNDKVKKPDNCIDMDNKDEFYESDSEFKPSQPRSRINHLEITPSRDKAVLNVEHNLHHGQSSSREGSFNSVSSHLFDAARQASFRGKISSAREENDDSISDNERDETNVDVVDAIKSGNVWLLKQMNPISIKTLFFLDAKNVSRNLDTPLILAAKNGQLKVMQFLLNLTPPICDAHQGSQEHGTNALMELAKFKFSDNIKSCDIEATMRLLIDEHKVDVNKTDNIGHTALILASHCDNNRVVKSLLNICSNNNDINLLVDIQADTGNSAVMSATMHENIQILGMLIEAGADFNLHNVKGSIPLTGAASIDAYRSIDYIIKHNPPICDPNLYNSETGKTALIVASEAPFAIESLKILLTCNDIDLNIQDNQGNTALIHTAIVNNIEGTRLLLSAKSTKLEITNNYGDTAVLEAVRGGNLKILEMLHNHGAKFDVVTDTGYTPLLVASQNGHVDLIDYLIDSSLAAVNEQNGSTGETALMISVENANDEVLKLLLNKKNIDVNIKDSENVTPLIKATMRNNIKAIQELVTNSHLLCDVNAIDDHGETALIWAAKTGNNKAVELLFNYGKNINSEIVDHAGYRAVSKAILAGNVDTLKLLKQFGARFDINIVPDKSKPQEWKSLLNIASRHGGTDMTKYLIDEAKICEFDQVVDSFGNTAMMLATQSNNVELMIYLIRKDKGEFKIVHGSNNFNQTPLFFAGFGDAVEAMRYLLRNYDINVNMKDVIGDTTFHYAAMNGSFRAIKYLYENYKHVIDIDATNKKGETALMMARKKNCVKIIEYLVRNGAKEARSQETDEINLGLHQASVREQQYQLSTFV